MTMLEICCDVVARTLMTCSAEQHQDGEGGGALSTYGWVRTGVKVNKRHVPVNRYVRVTSTRTYIRTRHPVEVPYNHSMDEDGIYDIDSAGELTEQSAMEEQRASLQTYLDSLSYECETVEEMQSRLEEIVQKIYICARTKNWLVLSTWDGMLQWYVP